MIVIHHGSGVEKGLADVLEDKTLVKPPYDDLKTDKVKDLVEVYSQVWPVENPALVAGPLDEANPSVLDILLKSIEEPLEGSPELILWARDLGSVPDTIRSRCGEKYHYQPEGRHLLFTQAESVLDAVLNSDMVSLSGVLSTLDSKSCRDFLEAYVEVILERGVLDLYSDRLKSILRRTRVSVVAVYGFFLGELSCQ